MKIFLVVLFLLFPCLAAADDEVMQMRKLSGLDVWTGVWTQNPNTPAHPYIPFQIDDEKFRLSRTIESGFGSTSRALNYRVSDTLDVGMLNQSLTGRGIDVAYAGKHIAVTGAIFPTASTALITVSFPF